MPAKKKSEEIAKWQGKLVDHIDKISQMTSGQRLKNCHELIDGFNHVSCRLLGAIENHFNPPTKKQDPPDGD